MANLTDALHDERVGHQIDLLRIDAKIRREILAMLDAVSDDIIAELAKMTPEGKATERYARLEKLKAKVDAAIESGYADIADGFDVAMGRLAAIETEFATRSVSNAVGFSVASINFNRAQIVALANRSMIEGAPSREWWQRQSQVLQNRFIDEMRKGVIQGESLGQLVQRVRGTKANGYTDGIMMTNRKRAEAIVRTSVMNVANAAALEVYQENTDIIKAIEWVSTLDNKTTPICRALDGLTWEMDGTPIGHDKQFPGPTAHWGCRSTQIAVTKSWEEMATNKELGRKLDEVYGKDKGTRASMDGQVSATMTYEQWLRSKDEPFQKELLGEGRYKLWKKGLIGMTDLTDQSNRPLTLAQLEEKVRRM